MNKIEKQMVELLKDLRDNHGVVELKAEFESEAARLNEVMRLKEIIERVGLGLIIKIGGSEAITDMFHAQQLGVSGLIAPMIESAYSLSKYLQAIKTYFKSDLRKEIHFGVNIETYLASENLPEMLKLKGIRLIDTITVGRVDLVGSMGLGRTDVNNEKVYKVTEGVFLKAKKKGFRTTMGGGIAIEAIPFITKLVNKKLLDRFETRKIVFKAKEGLAKAEEAIVKANKFELLWLENKKKYYGGIFREDELRIKMLKKRISSK